MAGQAGQAGQIVRSGTFQSTTKHDLKETQLGRHQFDAPDILSSPFPSRDSIVTSRECD